MDRDEGLPEGSYAIRGVACTMTTGSLLHEPPGSGEFAGGFP